MAGEVEKPTIAETYGSGPISASAAKAGVTNLLNCKKWTDLIREAIIAIGVGIYSWIWYKETEKSKEKDGQAQHQEIHQQNQSNNEVTT